MDNNLAENELPEENYKPYDKQTDKRMHEHLSNEHDEITEDDIRNIRTGAENLAEIPLSDLLPDLDETQNDPLEDDNLVKKKDNCKTDVDNLAWNIQEQK